MVEGTSRYRLYATVQQNVPKIYEAARKAGPEIGVTDELRGRIGATGAVSGFPGSLTEEVSRAIEDSFRSAVALSKLTNDLRDLIKDFFGDKYDAAPINTCEAGLWTCFDVLAAPPMTGRGETYRARYIAPYERHMHHQAGYGRPFPPKYKGIIASRGVTSGELGMEGKRQFNLDTVIVPLPGAKYEAHGIKYHTIPLLADVDPESSGAELERTAERHRDTLSAVTSLGYDTPGYGYGAKDSEGTPKLQKALAKIAAEFNIPYITDNAWGIPFVGTDLRKTGADLMTYSMDKAAGAPTSGLIVGKEEYMIPIRSALGLHSERSGSVSAYGKAELVTFDAGKEAIVGQIAALKVIRNDPARFKKPIDDLHKIVKEEFEKFAYTNFLKDFVITKTYNSGSIEINYQKTWDKGRTGIPIFSIEDFYAGSEPIMGALRQMGIVPTVSYDANIMISPGVGTIDKNGDIVEERARVTVRGVVKALELVTEYSGVVKPAPA